MKNPFVPEYGHVRAMTQAGAEFVFSPALSSMAAIGSPAEIVQTYAELHRDDAGRVYLIGGGSDVALPSARILAARKVLHACCVAGADDLFGLIGYFDEDGPQDGVMPESELVGLAIHLMKNGIIGKAKPGESSGTYSETFDAAEHIANAVVHLGLSRAEAAQLTMTELHYMLDAKFPKKKAGGFDMSPEEYQRGMREAEETLARLAAREAANHV